MAALEPGEVVAERFEVEALAGRGGSSSVYRARDRLTGGQVALKILETSRDDEGRFDREARILAGLTHPGIAAYVAHGYGSGGRWLAMEWLSGRTLAERLERECLSIAESVHV